MGEKVICLDGEGKTLKTGKELKIRPDLDLYIHPTFEKTKRGDKIPLFEVLKNWLKGFQKRFL